MPIISVIVPVYNVEKYIEKCLLSIRHQSFQDFECLIVDDGSKDESIKIAEKVIEGDDRFVIYHKENGGLSDARNYALDRVKGEYLLLIDSDDYIGESLLEDCYAMAKRYDSDIVCFDMVYVWEDGREEVSSGADFEVSSYKENPSLIFINNSSNNKMYRTSFMKEKRFIKGMWYEDLAVIPTWLAKANNVSHVAKPLYFYLQREGSISHSADPRIFDIYKAMNKVKEDLNCSGDELLELYLDNCLVMTTLRIRDIEDTTMRKDFFKEHIKHLKKDCPNWYEATKKKEYNLRQRIVFFLLHKEWIDVLDRIYRK